MSHHRGLLRIFQAEMDTSSSRHNLHLLQCTLMSQQSIVWLLRRKIISSSPVTEDTLCDTCFLETDDLIQEPAETMVTDGPTTASTEHFSLTDDHAPAHPPIKRRRDEDDPDSVAGRDGMRLRPANTLKHTCCGTH
nr:uncharacterized protein LOC117280813 [Nicotiana tomentosiformis]